MEQTVTGDGKNVAVVILALDEDCFQCLAPMRHANKEDRCAERRAKLKEEKALGEKIEVRGILAGKKRVHDVRQN